MDYIQGSLSSLPVQMYYTRKYPLSRDLDPMRRQVNKISQINHSIDGTINSKLDPQHASSEIPRMMERVTRLTILPP